MVVAAGEGHLVCLEVGDAALREAGHVALGAEVPFTGMPCSLIWSLDLCCFASDPASGIPVNWFRLSAVLACMRLLAVGSQNF